MLWLKLIYVVKRASDDDLLKDTAYHWSIDKIFEKMILSLPQSKPEKETQYT